MKAKESALRKIIKKTGRISLRVFAFLSLLILSLYVAFRSPAFQTWITGKAAAYLSKELKTTVTVRGVNVEWPVSAVFEGIYVEDLHGDTLLFADRLSAAISKFSLDNQYVNISNVTLSNSVIKLKKYPTEKGLSFKFIVKYFEPKDTTKKTESAPWNVVLGDINLENVTVAYMDTRDIHPAQAMNFEDIRATSIYGKFSDINPMGDSLSLRIKGLKAHEKSGFDLSSFNARVVASDTFIKLENLKIRTPNSNIQGFIGFHYKTFDDFEDDFINKVHMDAHLSNAIVDFYDISFFAPDLLGMKKKVMITGDVYGTVKSLRGKNIDLRFGKISHIACNFRMNGLPDFETTDMQFKVREGITNYEDLQGIPVPPFKEGKKLKVRDNIALLGNIVFKGKFEGFSHDFLANGFVTTAIGNISATDVYMRQPQPDAEFEYGGVVKTDNFNMGKYFDIPGVGHVTSSAEIQGVGLDIKTLHASVIKGFFSSFEYDGYHYKNINVDNADVTYRVFTGKFTMDDPNIKLVFNGNVDFSKSLPAIDFRARIKNARLEKLGYASDKNEHLLSASIHMNFTGDNIDNLDGSIKADSLDYYRDGERYFVKDISLFNGVLSNGQRRLLLESDIVRMSVSGNFEILKLPVAASDIMSDFIPAFFKPQKETKGKKKTYQQFEWAVDFLKNTRPIQAIVPGLIIKPGTHLDGKFDQQKRTVSAKLLSEAITYNAVRYKLIDIAASNAQPDKFQITGTLNRAELNDTTGLGMIKILSEASANNFNNKISWNNNSLKRNEGSADIAIHFDNDHAFQTRITKTSFYINDSLWIVEDDNFIAIDTSHVRIDNFSIKSGLQALKLNGNISKNPDEKLLLDLTSFNLKQLNYFTESNNLTLSGFVTGTSEISDVYKTLVFRSNVDFEKLYINNQHIGYGNVISDWDKTGNAITLDGHFTRDKIVRNIEFKGKYFPKNEKDQLDVKATLQNIPLAILKPLFKDYCSVMEGQVGGNLNVTGKLSEPELDGKLTVSIRSVLVDYLGARVSSQAQEIVIEKNAFFFNDYKLMDGYGDFATVYGHVYHDHFKNFQLDMDLRMDNFMVLNTTEEKNELYFGRVFASGYMNIFGFVDQGIRIDMNVRTDKSGTLLGQPLISEFNIPLVTTSEVGSSDYIFFVNKKAGQDSLQKKRQLKNNSVELHMNVEVTEDALVNVIFDKKVGDEIKAKGTGNLKMDISQAGDFSIKGQYTLSKGNYLFTMQNIIFVPFDIAKGGTISWNGDPYDARIDADAVYKTTASVEPFFPLDSAHQAYHRSYPVNVIMHLDSLLMNPQVNFSIDLPTADQNIRETVASYTQTELEKNRQVLSLMILNSFMTPSEFRDATSQSNNYVGGTSATLLSNFVSGTLNNWLSQISTDFNVGVKYRPNDGISSQELKLYLGTQLLNNKVTIDGNIGMQNANTAQATTTNQFIGDVNVEYKVTDDGKVRLRAFNRSNDNTMLNATAPYTQGVGVFYREEFNSVGELLKRYKNYLLEENPNRKKRKEKPQSK
ncbi:MAG: translocation/assembly module TamB domain-containing protein [Bacteroidia bacterium]